MGRNRLGRNVTPCLPREQESHSSLADAELGSELLLSDATCRVSPSNLPDLLFGKYGSADMFPSRNILRVKARRMGVACPCSPFLRLVLHVVQLRSEPEVISPDAQGGVAAMEHEYPRRNGLALKLVGHPVGEARPPVDRHKAVTAVVSHRSAPEPAPVRVCAARNLAPEPLVRMSTPLVVAGTRAESCTPASAKVPAAPLAYGHISKHIPCTVGGGSPTWVGIV
jgi:hypothetical protein